MAALVRKNILNLNKIIYRSVSLSNSRWASSRDKNDEPINLDEPIKYSTSKAATWKAEHSFSGTTKEDVTPSYQPLVICGSLAVFLIYFGILREENDIDQQLGMTLYDRIDGMEVVQLRTAIKYYKENDPGYDTRAMEKRLREIERK